MEDWRINNFCSTPSQGNGSNFLMHHSLVKLGQKTVASFLTGGGWGCCCQCSFFSRGRFLGEVILGFPILFFVQPLSFESFAKQSRFQIDHMNCFSYLQSKSLKYCMFWHSSRIVNRINFDPIFCSRTESSHMEDRLVGADIHHHFSITRIEHLQRKIQNCRIYGTSTNYV